MNRLTLYISLVLLFGALNLQSITIVPGLIKLNDNKPSSENWFAHKVQISADGKFAVYSERNKSNFDLWLIDIDEFELDSTKRKLIYSSNKYEEVLRFQFHLAISNDGSVILFEAPNEETVAGNTQIYPMMHLYFPRTKKIVKLFAHETISGNFLFTGGPINLSNDGKSLIFHNNIGWESFLDNDKNIQFKKNPQMKYVIWKCAVSEDAEAIENSATVMAESDFLYSSNKINSTGQKILGLTRWDPSLNSLNRLYLIENGKKKNIFTDNRSYYPGQNHDMEYDRYQIAISGNGKFSAYILDTVTPPHADKPLNGYKKIGIFDENGLLLRTVFGPEEMKEGSTQTRTTVPKYIQAISDNGLKIIVIAESPFTFNDKLWLLNLESNTYQEIKHDKILLVNPNATDACLDAKGDITGFVIGGQAYIWKMGKKIFIVNSIDDIDDGVCDSKHCSLREAINAANNDNTPGERNILLNLGAKDTIRVIKGLPELLRDIKIGSSQPLNEKICIDGSQCSEVANGLFVSAGKLYVSNIEIRNFKANGICSESDEILYLSSVSCIQNGACGVLAKNDIIVNPDQKTIGWSSEFKKNGNCGLYSTEKNVSVSYSLVDGNGSAGAAAMGNLLSKGSSLSYNRGDGGLSIKGNIYIAQLDEWTYSLLNSFRRNKGCGLNSSQNTDAMGAINASENNSFGVASVNNVYVNYHSGSDSTPPIDIKQSEFNGNGRENYYFKLRTYNYSGIEYDSIPFTKIQVSGAGLVSWEQSFYGRNILSSENNGPGIMVFNNIYSNGCVALKNQGDGLFAWKGEIELTRWLKGDSTQFIRIEDNAGSGIVTSPTGHGESSKNSDIRILSGAKIQRNSEWGIKSSSFLYVNMANSFRNLLDLRISQINENGKGITFFVITEWEKVNKIISGGLEQFQNDRKYFVGGGIWSVNASIDLSNCEIDGNGGPGVISYNQINAYGIKSRGNNGPGAYSLYKSIFIREWFPDTTQNEVSNNNGYGIRAGGGGNGFWGFLSQASIKVYNNSYWGIHAQKGSVMVNTTDGSLSTFDYRVSEIKGNGYGSEYYFHVNEWDKGSEFIGIDKVLKNDRDDAVWGGGLWSENSVTCFYADINNNNGPGICAYQDILTKEINITKNNGTGLYSQFGEVKIDIGSNKYNYLSNISENKGDGIYSGGIRRSGVNIPYSAIKITNNAGWGIRSLQDVNINNVGGLSTNDSRISKITGNGTGDSIIVLDDWTSADIILTKRNLKKNLETVDGGGIISYRKGVTAYKISLSDNQGPGLVANGDIVLRNSTIDSNNGPGVYSFLGTVQFEYGLKELGINYITNNNGVGVYSGAVWRSKVSPRGIYTTDAIEVENNSGYGLFSNLDTYINYSFWNSKDAYLDTESIIRNNCLKDEYYDITNWNTQMMYITMKKIKLYGYEKCGVLDSGSFHARNIKITGNGGDGLKVKEKAVLDNFVIADNLRNGIIIGDYGDFMNGIVSYNGDAGAKANYFRKFTNVKVSDNNNDGVVLGVRAFNYLQNKDRGNEKLTPDFSELTNSVFSKNGNDGINVSATNDKDVIVSNSFITANKGFGVNNNGKIIVSAKANWWGSATGPSGEGKGTGDEISINVDYDKFLSNGTGLTVSFESDYYYSSVAGNIRLKVFAINNNLQNDNLLAEISDDLDWLQSSKTVNFTQSDGNRADFFIIANIPESQNETKNQIRLKVNSISEPGLVSYDTIQLISYKPKLTRIAISPDTSLLFQNEGTRFSLFGFDQRNKPFEYDSIKWTAVGGNFDSTGYYFAGTVPGIYELIAQEINSGIAGKCHVVVTNSVLEVNNKNNFELNKEITHCAYPNPFTYEITIKYLIAKSGFVTVRICNLLGHEVFKTMTEYKEQHTNEIKWQPAYLPKGLYYYQIYDGYQLINGVICYD